jgi:hypothetical protein
MSSEFFFSAPSPFQKTQIKALDICPDVSPLMYISKFHTAKIVINFLQGNSTDRR